MGLVLTVFFLVLWAAVGFFLLRFLARRYFHEPRRADTAALAVVVAFAAGAMWPFSERFGGGATLGQVADAVPTAVATPLPVPAVRPSPRLVACKASPALLAGGTGFLDGMHEKTSPTPILDGEIVPSRSTILVVGWAADREMNGPASGICLVVDGHIETKAKVARGLRPDLVTGFHKEGLLWCGYFIEIGPGTLHTGHVRIEVAEVAPDGSVRLLKGTRNVIVE